MFGTWYTNVVYYQFTTALGVIRSGAHDMKALLEEPVAQSNLQNVAYESHVCLCES
jgi:hypothetical protein